jgi:hypothetical protein
MPGRALHRSNSQSLVPQNEMLERLLILAPRYLDCQGESMPAVRSKYRQMTPILAMMSAGELFIDRPSHSSIAVAKVGEEVRIGMR